MTDDSTAGDPGGAEAADGSEVAGGPDPDLIVRPWVETDATGFREAVDEDVTHLRPWLSWTLEEPATLERTRHRLAGFIEQFRNGEAWRFAVTPADAPHIILGGVGLNTRVGPNAHDISYWVRGSAARQGIAAAAVSALMVEAFDRRGVDRLVIHCDVANTASAAFAAHMGFLYVGRTGRPYADGTPRPLLEFEMIRESYVDEHAQNCRKRARRVRLDLGRWG